MSDHKTWSISETSRNMHPAYRCTLDGKLMGFIYPPVSSRQFRAFASRTELFEGQYLGSYDTLKEAYDAIKEMGPLL